jgi:hAT family C-terminal dimerisation region
MVFFDSTQKSKAWEFVQTEMVELYKVTLRERAAAAGDAAAASNATAAAANNATAGNAAAATAQTGQAASKKSSMQAMLDGDSEEDADDTAITGTDASATMLSDEMLTERCESELNFYKKAARLDLDKNPLEWWKNNAEYYALLAAVARKWLAVPASSAASERLFSAAGLVVTKKRTSLKAERVESLVFLKAVWSPLQKLGYMY